jgi:hypothetical protein
MNFRKLSALAGVTVLLFGACTTNTPAGSAAPGGSSGAVTQPDACKSKVGTST